MILLLSDDLLDASKTSACARAAGLSVKQCKTLAQAETLLESGGIRCCIVDLQLPNLDLEKLLATAGHTKPTCRVIAYGSHVNAEQLKFARSLGCDPVMPRSQFFDEMPRQIAEWAKAIDS